MSSPNPESSQTWSRKFANAGNGVRWAISGQSSFYVHFAASLGVVAAGVWLRVSRIEWCLLILCMTIVLACEAMNSALENLAPLIDERHNPRLGKTLDMASGAVLICACGAALVGLLVFLFRLGVWLSF